MNSVLSATFPSAKHRVLGTGLARLQKVRERNRETERERERERERFIVWGCGKISLPCPCLFCCQSVTLSAQDCTSLIHCTVCLVSTHVYQTCLSFPWQWPFLSTELPIGVATANSGISQMFSQFWPSSRPTGAGRALLPLTAPPPMESEDFRSRDFSLVPLAQGYKCLVAILLPFGRALSLFLAHCNGISVTALSLYINVIRISMILRCTLVQ